MVHTCKHMVMKTLLETYRLEHSLTYDGLARAVGTSARSTVFNHCHGARSVSPKFAILYEKKLGIPKSDLRPDIWPKEEPSHAPEA